MEIAKYVTNNKSTVSINSRTENGVTRYQTEIATANFKTPYYKGTNIERANRAYTDAVKLLNKENL
mgnify:CR=1 FL=1